MPSGEGMRCLHVFDESIQVATENAFISEGVYDCSFRIVDCGFIKESGSHNASGGEGMRCLHVFDESIQVATENAFISEGVYDCSFRIVDWRFKSVILHS